MNPARRPVPLPPASELHVYRGKTVSLLRRYFALSLEAGRLPSLLGREVFRSRVEEWPNASFEDNVIFVHDIERCLEQLNPYHRSILARILFESYTFEEAGRRMGRDERHIRRLFPCILDSLSRTFLRLRLLHLFPTHQPQLQPPAQRVSAGEATPKARKVRMNVARRFSAGQGKRGGASPVRDD